MVTFNLGWIRRTGKEPKSRNDPQSCPSLLFSGSLMSWNCFLWGEKISHSSIRNEAQNLHHSALAQEKMKSWIGGLSSVWLFLTWSNWAVVQFPQTGTSTSIWPWIKEPSLTRTLPSLEGSKDIWIMKRNPFDKNKITTNYMTIINK